MGLGYPILDNYDNQTAENILSQISQLRPVASGAYGKVYAKGSCQCWIEWKRLRH